MHSENEAQSIQRAEQKDCTPRSARFGLLRLPDRARLSSILFPRIICRLSLLQQTMFVSSRVPGLVYRWAEPRCCCRVLSAVSAPAYPTVWRGSLVFITRDTQDNAYFALPFVRDGTLFDELPHWFRILDTPFLPPAPTRGGDICRLSATTRSVKTLKK